MSCLYNGTTPTHLAFVHVPCFPLHVCLMGISGKARTGCPRSSHRARALPYLRHLYRKGSNKSHQRAAGSFGNSIRKSSSTIPQVCVPACSLESHVLSACSARGTMTLHAKLQKEFGLSFRYQGMGWVRRLLPSRIILIFSSMICASLPLTTAPRPISSNLPTMSALGKPEISSGLTSKMVSSADFCQ